MSIWRTSQTSSGWNSIETQISDKVLVPGMKTLTFFSPGPRNPRLSCSKTHEKKTSGRSLHCISNVYYVYWYLERHYQHKLYERFSWHYPVPEPKQLKEINQFNHLWPINAFFDIWGLVCHMLYNDTSRVQLWVKLLGFQVCWFEVILVWVPGRICHLKLSWHYEYIYLGSWIRAGH